MELNQILLGDCLLVLKELPDESCDAVITDPPYGLGAKDPSPIDIFMYVLGGGLDTGGDFMGRDWQIPSVAVWREVYRVLKPGGHVVSFGGTRTFDLISIGLRLAGFESRDTIAREFPNLQWIQGQGMPKSRALGEGWGSGLKPSWEPILVFRKPFKGTLTKNVMTHGTGGLNIDATRVKHISKEDFEAHRKGVEAIREKGGSRDKSWKNSSDLSGANEVQAAGRWPSNTLFEHSPGCRRVGTKKVKGNDLVSGVGRGKGGYASGVYGSGWKGQAAGVQLGYVDADGLEEVESWECMAGCPVLTLDEQSGDRPSTLTGRADPNSSHTHPGTEMNPNSTFLGERTHLSRVYADEGGASRFFAQFEAEGGAPFKYVAKANRKEAGSGEFEVEHITLKPLSLVRWLVRLVTPKGGVVLDCYAGSGTTCHAALLEEMSYIGIERDPENHAEALKRLEVAQRLADERREAQELFDFAMGRTCG